MHNQVREKLEKLFKRKEKTGERYQNRIPEVNNR